jgi:hypothetical protein
MFNDVFLNSNSILTNNEPVSVHDVNLQNTCTILISVEINTGQRCLID